MQSLTFTIPNGLIITSNRRTDTWRRQRTKNVLKPQAEAFGAQLEPMGKATIYVGITKRTKGAYDPANLTDTLKPIVDGLVTAGVVDEDDYHHVLGPFPFHEGVDRRLDGCLRATFYLLPYSAVPF